MKTDGHAELEGNTRKQDTDVKGETAYDGDAIDVKFRVVDKEEATQRTGDALHRHATDKGPA